MEERSHIEDYQLIEGFWEFISAQMKKAQLQKEEEIRKVLGEMSDAELLDNE